MSTPFVALVSSYLIQQLDSRTLPPWEAISTVTLHTDSLPQAGTGNDIWQTRHSQWCKAARESISEEPHEVVRC